MTTPTSDNEALSNGPHVVPPHFVPFERALDNDWNLAMSEGDKFLRGEGNVHETLARLAKRLHELEIPYAIAGGMALYKHGFRRVTDDVDLIVTRPDLQKLHQHLDGLGYLRPFATSKNLRDVRTKVKIEFLVAGDYPGDGKPKPIAFPDPRDASELRDGLQVLTLPRLVELKLASGMTGFGRMKDIGDVEQLILVFKLPRSFSSQLHDYVRPKFLETWDSIHAGEQRFIYSLRCEALRGCDKSFETVTAALPDLAPMLAEMHADGLIIDDRSRREDELVYIATSDPALARKYNMDPESPDLFAS